MSHVLRRLFENGDKEVDLVRFGQQREAGNRCAAQHAADGDDGAESASHDRHD